MLLEAALTELLVAKDYTPLTLADQPEAVAALYDAVRAARRHPPHQENGQELQWPVAPPTASGKDEDEDDLTDAEVVVGLQRHERSRRLWEGDWERLYHSQSHADLALCQFIGRWCGYDPKRMDALFRQSGLYREKWDERHYADGRTYSQGTIAMAISTAFLRDALPDGPLHRQGEQCRLTSYPWQQQMETQEQREARLSVYASHMRARVEAHAHAGQPSWLVLKAPPGVGKSYAVSALALEQLDLAYVGENHAQHESLPALRALREVEPCTAVNCPTPERHKLLADAGYKTSEAHWHSGRGCAYARQFTFDEHGHGSTFYQVEHLKTPYPARHQVIVVDELTLSKWLREEAVTRDKLDKALEHVAAGSPEETLLQAVEAVITDVRRQNHERKARDEEPLVLHGQALFNALDARTGGLLVDLLLALDRDPQLAVARPETGLGRRELEAAERAGQLPPVVLPQVVRALLAEFAHWLADEPWNSRVAIGPGERGYALYLTTPLRLHPQVTAPRVLLNATANEQVLRHLFDAHDVHIEEPMQLDPPPHTRHLAVRFKRYAKSWLTWNADELRRAIAEVRYLLRKVDPEGALCAAGQVGLITYEAVEQQMAQALGIRSVPITAPKEEREQGRTMHFWAARGSNRLADCAVLLVVGTPALPDEQVYREARALYFEDERPIKEGVEVRSGVRCYVDERVRTLSAFRTNEELTQCAHRNRPLRYDGRIVITLCQGDVEYLPITEAYTDLPRLTDDGEDRQAVKRDEGFAQLDAAEAALQAEGVLHPSLRVLRERAHVSQQMALDWRAAKRAPPDADQH